MHDTEDAEKRGTTVIYSGKSGAELARSYGGIAALGDVNGDGCDDLAVGSHTEARGAASSASCSGIAESDWLSDRTADAEGYKRGTYTVRAAATAEFTSPSQPPLDDSGATP